MMLQTTTTIRHERRGNRVFYNLCFTFSRELVAALGWSFGQRIGCTLFSRAIRLEPIPQGNKLQRHLNRPGVLIARYRLSPQQRKQFLNTFSNNLSTKVRWESQGMFALNGRLILSGKGKPVLRKRTRQ